jgi:hypothetical protein
VKLAEDELDCVGGLVAVARRAEEVGLVCWPRLFEGRGQVYGCVTISQKFGKDVAEGEMIGRLWVVGLQALPYGWAGVIWNYVLVGGFGSHW